MKEVWSVVVFAIEVICFVVFLVTVKPNAPIYMQGGNAMGDCRTNSLETRECRFRAFAAMAEDVVRRR
jgi:hypothetical protein